MDVNYNLNFSFFFIIRSYSCKKIFRSRGSYRDCSQRAFRNFYKKWRNIRYQRQYWPILQTYYVSVRGNCCWEIVGSAYHGGGKQKMWVGTNQKVPDFGFIRKVRSLKNC